MANNNSKNKKVVPVATQAASAPVKVVAALPKVEKVEMAAAPKAPTKPVLVANQPASDETRPTRTPTHAEIAQRAFELFAKRRGTNGTAQEDWLNAEKELRARRS